jgi:hypothetical protein
MKEEIINKVNKFTDNNTEALLKIEKTQYRDMVEVCKNAEFFGEIELYIKYKISKSQRDWGHIVDFNKNKTLGDMIIDEINELKTGSEKETIENLSKYFGYLNWKMSYEHVINRAKKRSYNNSGRR